MVGVNIRAFSEAHYLHGNFAVSSAKILPCRDTNWGHALL